MKGMYCMEKTDWIDFGDWLADLLLEGKMYADSCVTITKGFKQTSDKDSYTLEFIIPGSAKEDVELTSKIIEGKKKIFLTLKKDSVFFAKGDRSVELPSGSNLKNISSTLKDGILTIKIGKMVEEESKVKIDIA
jgi:HSP20 family molecular chaperone IbpA